MRLLEKISGFRLKQAFRWHTLTARAGNESGHMNLAMSQRGVDAVDGLPPDVQQFWRVWSAARKGAAVPMRSAIKVGDLKKLAANLFVAEKTSDTEFIIRMTGTGFDAMFGRNLTGQDLTAITHPELAHKVTAFCNAVLAVPCGGYIRNILTTAEGKQLQSDGLTLPVLAADGERRLVMCYTGIRGVGYSLEGTGDITLAGNSEIEEAFFMVLD